MEIVPIEVISTLIDITLPAPLGFQQARLDDFAAKVCDSQKGLNLRPDQIRLRRWDDLFGYELVANFFGENGSLSRTPDHVKFSVRNARTLADWKVICDSIQRLHSILQLPATTQTQLWVQAHARFESEEARDRWLQQFATTPLLARAGTVGHVRIPEWDRDVRVLIEQSNAVPAAVFVEWSTQYANAQDWDSFLSTIPTMLENSVNHFELGLEPLRARL